MKRLITVIRVPAGLRAGCVRAADAGEITSPRADPDSDPSLVRPGPRASLPNGRNYVGPLVWRVELEYASRFGIPCVFNASPANVDPANYNGHDVVRAVAPRGN
jgi:hypothetical protein